MKYFLLSIVVIAAMSAGCDKQQSPAPTVSQSMTTYDRQLNVGDKTLNVEIVTTPQQMQRGLSGREPLTDEQGMLFDYGKGSSEMPRFWMKDMKFDLDLIWIKDNKIVSITKNVPKPALNVKDNQLPIYTPPSPVDAVLEVNAGWTDKNNVTVGDVVRLK